jgi:hypothetical protein
MTRTEDLLKLFLRLVGSVSLLATFFAFIPYSWMNAIHAWLGMGELPNAPVVMYLARSTSALYAILGGLMWTLSLDVRRFRPVLSYLGAVLALLGLFLTVFDWVEGMPLFWQLGEGPIDLGIGLAIFLLSRRVGPAGEDSAGEKP